MVWIEPCVPGECLRVGVGHTIHDERMSSRIGLYRHADRLREKIKRKLAVGLVGKKWFPGVCWEMMGVFANDEIGDADTALGVAAGQARRIRRRRRRWKQQLF